MKETRETIETGRRTREEWVGKGTGGPGQGDRDSFR